MMHHRLGLEDAIILAYNTDSEDSDVDDEPSVLESSVDADDDDWEDYEWHDNDMLWEIGCKVRTMNTSLPLSYTCK